jgi:hypothetical protein
VTALLRFGDTEVRAEVGEPGSDGVVFVRLFQGGTFMPFRQTPERTVDGLPVFTYAM